MIRRRRNNERSGDIAAHSQKSAGKFLASIFEDHDVILLTNYLPKGQTINAEYYSFLLVHFMDILKENTAGGLPGLSCSCMTVPRLTGHLQENGIPGLPVS